MPNPSPKPLDQEVTAKTSSTFLGFATPPTRRLHPYWPSFPYGLMIRHTQRYLLYNYIRHNYITPPYLHTPLRLHTADLITRPTCLHVADLITQPTCLRSRPDFTQPPGLHPLGMDDRESMLSNDGSWSYCSCCLSFRFAVEHRRKKNGKGGGKTHPLTGKFDYQLALVTPGIRPFEAISRN